MDIGLLICDDVSAELRHIAGGYQDMFDALLRPHMPGLKLSAYDLRKGELPLSAEAHDAFLCSGSRHSVYERLDWIDALKAFVRQLRDADKTYVGICFGHQLLAAALGGEVAKAE